jgi:hypothetical protein
MVGLAAEHAMGPVQEPGQVLVRGLELEPTKIHKVESYLEVICETCYKLFVFHRHRL